MRTLESAYSGKTIVRGAVKNEGATIVMLKKKKHKKVDISINSTINKENVVKLFAQGIDIPTSTKEIKNVETIKPFASQKDILIDKIVNKTINKNLSRHQDWMFKQCGEYLFNNIKAKEGIIWKDNTDRFIRYCNSIKPAPINYEIAKRKFKMILRYYQKLPEIRPNYCKTDESSLIMKNLTEKIHHVVLHKKNYESQKKEENNGSNSNETTIKITSKVFTDSFYQTMINKSQKFNDSINDTEKSTSSETPFCNKKKMSRRSSKQEHNRSSLVELLQNESLISRNKEELAINSEFEISDNYDTKTFEYACSETQKIKEMKLILKHTISNNSTIRNQSIDQSDNKKVNLSNHSRQNSTIMDLINKVRNQKCFNKTLGNDKSDTSTLVKTFKKRQRISLKRLNSNYMLTDGREESKSAMGKYLSFSKRSSSSIKPSKNTSSQLESICENANTTEQIGLKSFHCLQNSKCPLPPKIPGSIKGHKRNFTSMLGNCTQFTSKAEMQTINEESKSTLTKNLFHEAFNKRLKLTLHKRCSSRNEESKGMSNTSNDLLKQGGVLPPLSSTRITISKNQ